MPVQAPQWSEYLSCPVCQNEFEVSLSHSHCKLSTACAWLQHLASLMTVEPTMEIVTFTNLP